MATIIKPDGTREELKGCEANGALSLEQLQTAVGGYFESFTAPDGTIFVGNEEAMFLNLPANLPARSVVAKAYGTCSLDLIVNLKGNILIVTADEEGNLY